MAEKPIVAIDVDDVLVLQAQNVIDYYNRTYGTKIGLKDFYSTNDLNLWNVKSRDEGISRVHKFVASDKFLKIPPLKDSLSIIRRLKEKYKLIIITGRPAFVKEETQGWLEDHFPETFEQVAFIDRYNVGGAKTPPKGELAEQIGVSVLIDDSLEWALDAAKRGIKVLLFGEYPWNQTDKLPSNVKRVKDWKAIEKELL